MPGSTRRPPEPDSPTVELLGGLIGDARDLAVAHLDSLRAEVRDELETLKRQSKFAGAAVAAFAVAGLLGSLALVQALWLYTTLPSWASYLIIAALFAGLGGLALLLRARDARREP